MSKHNLPSKPGLYWASQYPMLEEWELIVKINGVNPFLNCEFWEYKLTVHSRRLHFPEVLYFGPKIEIPARDPRARKLGEEDKVT